MSGRAGSRCLSPPPARRLRRRLLRVPARSALRAAGWVTHAELRAAAASQAHRRGAARSEGREGGREEGREERPSPAPQPPRGGEKQAGLRAGLRSGLRAGLRAPPPPAGREQREAARPPPPGRTCPRHWRLGPAAERKRGTEEAAALPGPRRSAAVPDVRPQTGAHRQVPRPGPEPQPHGAFSRCLAAAYGRLVRAPSSASGASSG